MIQQSTGRSLADIIPNDRDRKPSPSVKTYATKEDLLTSVFGATANYTYTNPETKRVELLVIRIERAGEKKTFMQAHELIGGRWVMQGAARPWPIYNRIRVQDADRVVIVEGERDVHTLHRYGIVATTSPAGAGKAGHADWKSLSGKSVILWADNDKSGVMHMADVKRELEALDDPPSISIVDIESLGLPDKGDVTDLVERLEEAGEAEIITDTLDSILDSASLLSPSGDLLAMLEDTIAGRRENIAFPWHDLSIVSRALLPGTVTLLCGNPGCSKSFFCLEALTYWTSRGVAASAFLLEDSMSTHLLRVLTQLAENHQLLDDEWTRLNPEIVRQQFQEHQELIDRVGERITVAPEMPPTYDDLIRWIEQRLEAGDRVLIIDPVSVIVPRDPWEADKNFLDRAKKLIIGYGASLLITTHPKLGAKGIPSMDHLAGGAAWPRFSHTVLWLKEMKAEDVVVNALFARRVESADRIMHVVKCRNGKGGGWKIAFRINRDSIRLECLGVVIED